MGYISKEDAINAIKAVPEGNWANKRYVVAIKGVPSADVVERKKGKWHDCYLMGKMDVSLMVCSYCNEHALMAGAWMPKFCPNCGADMREG